MPSRSHNQILARLSHKELIQFLGKRPTHPPLVQEFISRYDLSIRQNVARAIRARMAATRQDVIQPMIEETVNEVYYRLFRKEGRAFRRFRGRYENAIYAYLRTICVNTVRVQMHDWAWRQTCVSTQLLEEAHEKCRDEKANFKTISASCLASVDETIDMKLLEEVIRAGFFQAFCDKHVNRNFIIFKLHFLHGYRLHEIAGIKALGLSVSGVANATDRIRRWLRREFSSTPRPRTDKPRKVR